MRDLMNIVTETDEAAPETPAVDVKALKARLRAINPERRHLLALCMDFCAKAATARADGNEAGHAEHMARVNRAVDKVAELEKEADGIARQLGYDA